MTLSFWPETRREFLPLSAVRSELGSGGEIKSGV